MENPDFSKTDSKERLQAYLCRSLGEKVQLISSEQFAASSRSAPWHLVVKTSKGQRDYVLRMDEEIDSREISTLRAMAQIPEIPTPLVYGWEPGGRTFGKPCFLYDYMDGKSLLAPMLADERWAVDLYLDTVLQLNGINRDRLHKLGCTLPESRTALSELANAHEYFMENPSPLTDRIYRALMENLPDFPESRFSNGDLWLDNILVKDQKLIGMIDFEQAGFSDPVYEFLLPFFNEPRLRGRGIEERYCEKLGVDPGCLRWYHGLEYYDALHYVEKSGEAFNQYSSERLRSELDKWLAG